MSKHLPPAVPPTGSTASPAAAAVVPALLPDDDDPAEDGMGRLAFSGELAVSLLTLCSRMTQLRPRTRNEREASQS